MSQLVVRQYNSEEEEEYGEYHSFTTGKDSGILVKFIVYEDESVDGEIITSNLGNDFGELATLLRGLADGLDKGEVDE